MTLCAIRSSLPRALDHPAAGRPARAGAAAVEFAVVVPVLILIVFGMIEFSRVMMVEQILTNAAREGARKGSLPGTTTSDVTTAVSNYMTNSGLSGQTTTVSPDPSTANPGDAITVTVSIPFNNVSWLPVPMFLGGKTLSASVVMAKESNNS
jgi:Flp pilus assembly protein TadG